MSNWTQEGYQFPAKPAPGHEKVLIPGDPEREMEALRMQQGIPIVVSVEDDLAKVGEMFGVVL